MKALNDNWLDKPKGVVCLGSKLFKFCQSIFDTYLITNRLQIVFTYTNKENFSLNSYKFKWNVIKTLINYFSSTNEFVKINKLQRGT